MLQIIHSIDRQLVDGVNREQILMGRGLQLIGKAYWVPKMPKIILDDKMLEVWHQKRKRKLNSLAPSSRNLVSYLS